MGSEPCGPAPVVPPDDDDPPLLELVVDPLEEPPLEDPPLDDDAPEEPVPDDEDVPPSPPVVGEALFKSPQATRKRRMGNRRRTALLMTHRKAARKLGELTYDMPMRIVVGASIAAGLLVGMAWIGCVGEDPQPSGVTPDPGVADGDFRGRCNAGRCLEGLECYQGVCLYPNYPDGGLPPGVTLDGGDGGGSDASTGPCPRIDSPPAGMQVACPGADGGVCPAGETCCVGDSTEVCAPAPSGCAVKSKPVECDSPTQCGALKCCISLNGSIFRSTCPVTIDHATLDYAKCDNACTGATLKACRTDDDCGSAPCRRAILKADAGSIDIGFCNP